MRVAALSATVSALVAGSALAATDLGSSHSRPAPTAARLTSGTAAPPAAPPGSPEARIDAIWAAARARHPEPRVYTNTTDRPIDCDHLKCIAFTFDDGPSPATTGTLLRILAAHHVRATFMLVGQMVEADPAAVAGEARAGDMLGIHTWSHQSLRGRAVPNIADDIVRTSNAITKASGYRPMVVRPPYGAVGPKTAAEVPYPLIKWGIDSEDWRSRNPDAVFRQVTSTAAPGSIVLMHDTYASTIAAVPRLLDYYASRGYTFVTVSELYDSVLQPHRVYFGREKAVAAGRAADRRAGVVRAPWMDQAAPGEPASAPTEPAPAPTEPAAPPAEAATAPPSPASDRR
ncbi:MAG TPA: polysaccharide deacetylase family protein [Sporichthyaceae bacterium]|nr:polysaccharide deacetylase family protein [Sporichthyaceae bacterium]